MEMEYKSVVLTGSLLLGNLFFSKQHVCSNNNKRLKDNKDLSHQEELQTLTEIQVDIIWSDI